LSAHADRHEIAELSGLADDTPVRFTHADLDQANILVSTADDGPLRIVAIIDWHQSGWYPERLEVLKAQIVGEPGSDWVTKYLPKALGIPDPEYGYAFEYVSLATI
jgi:aminoglycoside phosphotransferase (APT) family kinase protein